MLGNCVKYDLLCDLFTAGYFPQIHYGVTPPSSSVRLTFVIYECDEDDDGAVAPLAPSTTLIKRVKRQSQQLQLDAQHPPGAPPQRKTIRVKCNRRHSSEFSLQGFTKRCHGL